MVAGGNEGIRFVVKVFVMALAKKLCKPPVLCDFFRDWHLTCEIDDSYNVQIPLYMSVEKHKNCIFSVTNSFFIEGITMKK